MMDGALTRRAFLVAVAYSATLTACRSAPARTYTLASTPGTARPGAPVAIVIRDIALPKYLDRPQIVRYGDAYELTLSDFERWGEPLSDMVGRLLVENLSQRLPRSTIYLAASPVAAPADAILDVDITRFEAAASGDVLLEARWAVRDEASDNTRWSQSTRFTATPVTSDTAALVAAMSDALGQLSDAMADSLVSGRV